MRGASGFLVLLYPVRPYTISEVFMIQVVMPDNSIRSFNAVSMQLDYALRAGGQPIRADGTPYNVQSYLPGFGIVPHGTPGSGYLFDNCPLNITLGNGWIPGQMSALTESGIDCQSGGGNCGCCPGGPPSGGGIKPNLQTGGLVYASPEPMRITQFDQARRIIELSRRFPLNSTVY